MQQPDIRTAVRIYYECSELDNARIRELFGGIAPSTIVRKKKIVHEEMIKRDVRTWKVGSVNTEVAYEVWGLDIARMEKAILRLQKLGIGDG